MSQIVHKMKKVLSGCMHKPNQKYNYNENDMNNPILINDEFGFSSPELPAASSRIAENNTDFPIYNDYDNLNHPCLAKNNVLKDSTNIKKSKGLKRCLKNVKGSKNVDENNNGRDNTENFKYSELYDSKRFNTTINEKQNTENEDLYCEIQEQETFTDLEPLVKIKSNKNQSDKTLVFTDLMNLKSTLIENEYSNLGVEKDNNNNKSLTDLKSADSFSSPEEGFHWYLNLINETITNCIQNDKTLTEPNRLKRLNIAKAHFLYARNFYEMRNSSSMTLKTKLAKMHPCLLVLACLLDSEAVRIEESHVCVCDTYVYLFSTRLKYCAWKSKLFILLKKPKRSSFDRLNLIEDLTNCHKTIQEKSA